MNCHACGTAVAVTARFCHKCGAPLSTPQGTQAAGWRAGLPWGVAGVALGALVAVVALRIAGGDTREAGGGMRDASGDPGSASRIPPPASRLEPPDISQMSPEERATRLYNRVMTLHSQGKADSAGF